MVQHRGCCHSTARSDWQCRPRRDSRPGSTILGFFSPKELPRPRGPQLDVSLRGLQYCQSPGFWQACGQRWDHFGEAGELWDNHYSTSAHAADPAWIEVHLLSGLTDLTSSVRLTRRLGS